MDLCLDVKMRQGPSIEGTKLGGALLDVCEGLQTAALAQGHYLRAPWPVVAASRLQLQVRCCAGRASLRWWPCESLSSLERRSWAAEAREVDFMLRKVKAPDAVRAAEAESMLDWAAQRRQSKVRA